MSVVDSAMTRDVLRDISKRPLDISDLHVCVMHVVVYLRGRVERIRGYYGDINLEDEVNRLVRLIRQKQGIRDVVCEIELGGLSLAERVNAERRQRQGYYRHV